MIKKKYRNLMKHKEIFFKFHAIILYTKYDIYSF